MPSRPDASTATAYGRAVDLGPWWRLHSPTPSARISGRSPSLHVRSEEHTSELQSLMRISYAVFCLKKKKKTTNTKENTKKATKSNTTKTASKHQYSIKKYHTKQEKGKQK